MKLYTEEKIIETFSTGVLSLYNGYIKERLETLTPIELPSDEDLEKAQKEQRLTMEEMCRFEEGVEWVIKRINNQNK